ncbi:hypothetical protein K0504_11930 [Neiella marina]|uniref:Maltose operon protein n=1 Tax=Neiella holothuriorum TaxID=2870530 RepID=A0ABS7EHH8_9GAMM|nr:MalM family protein [Neiella holothuriorum]MBW8191745.1 hypothetical protein [Neiella holothuriorum]
MTRNKFSLVATGFLAASLFLGSVAPAAAYDEPSASELVSSLSQTNDCCASIAEFSFQPMAIDGIVDLMIDANSPAYSFPSGKSYFAAIKLPDNVPTFSVYIKSRAKKSVFAPAALLLDANRQPVRVIPAAAARYTPAEMLDYDSLDLSFTIERSYLDNPKTEYYMVILTTPADMAGQTQMIHPAKLAAERSNTVPPDIADPIARHSPGGLINVELRSGTVESNADFLSRIGNTVNSWFGVEEAPFQQATQGVQVTGSEATAGGMSVVPVQPASGGDLQRSPTPGMQTPVARPAAVDMLPETEAFYNQLITTKVDDGDIDAAMRLVEEAERAGSKTARSAFVDAVKSLK